MSLFLLIGNFNIKFIYGISITKIPTAGGQREEVVHPPCKDPLSIMAHE
jgi:hypothetical protein